ncbi:MAG TPA: hypothetical protein VE820_05660 [Sphingomicrobium sp.]|jgi:hypothetical protein|nr:hypothetical protein [Sphingomicrobium sp.]
MIPMKTSSVFKSRWMALLWAAGIIWFAYDFAGSQPQPANASDNAEQATDATGTAVTPADENRFAQELNSF